MKPIYFAPEKSGFYAEMKERIDQYFKENGLTHFGTNALKMKLLTMLLVYIGAYISMLTFGENKGLLFAHYAFLGAWSVLLGLNIGHDAAHSAIFKKRSLNRKLLIVFDVLGTNSYNWVNRHLGAHHLFPNVMDYDSDIQQTEIVKIFPNDEHRGYHGYQYLYMPIIYMIYIFRWVIYRDFKDARSERIGVFDNSGYPKMEVVKMILFKLFYLIQMIVIPSLILPQSFLVTSLGFLLLTVVGSFMITLVLLSTHVGEDANFPEPDHNNVLPHSWSYHQVLTASDFGTNSRLLNTLFGGFNHHVIHHLFPHICHVHYPALTPILRELALKHGLPYRSNKYLLSAILSHFKLLKRNAKPLV